jgi:F5/8 type C domain
VLLHGLTGELDGKNYPGGVMAPMGTNTDEWIADVASYIRNGFGNRATFVTPAHVAEVRKANPRSSMWSFSELASSTPMPLLNQKEWKATASHSPERAADGINGSGATRWATTVAQEAGMWYQIELPQPVTVAEILLDTSTNGRGGAIPAVAAVGYRVQVSMDGATWSAPVAEGQGESPTTVISMKPMRARFIRITQTGKPQSPVGWAIQRVRISGIQ